jgi:PIN domain nuclease of toxin-antitoxin system
LKLLLDTHAFLWFALDDPQLSSTAKRTICEPATAVLVSPASYWEIAIKISIEKYVLGEPFEDFIRRAVVDNDFAVLAIEPHHTARLISLPHHHRDQFDRLLIAQAMCENVPIVSADAALDAYPVSRIW